MCRLLWKRSQSCFFCSVWQELFVLPLLFHSLLSTGGPEVWRLSPGCQDAGAPQQGSSESGDYPLVELGLKAFISLEMGKGSGGDGPPADKALLQSLRFCHTETGGHTNHIHTWPVKLYSPHLIATFEEKECLFTFNLTALASNQHSALCTSSHWKGATP